MNLADLASIAEIVGGLAVVISLIYLAIEVRQNTNSVRNATLQSNTAIWSSLLSGLTAPGVIEAYSAGISGKPDIQPLQYTQFFLLSRSLFVAFENQYYQYRKGALDQETYAGYERAISEQLLAFQGFRYWWQQNRGVFSPAFVQRVDEMIQRTPVAAPNKFIEEWRSLHGQAPDDNQSPG